MKNSGDNDAEDFETELPTDMDKALKVMKSREMSGSVKENFDRVLEKELAAVNEGGSRIKYFIVKYLINPIRLSAVRDESLETLKATEYFLYIVWFLVRSIIHFLLYIQ